MGLADTAKLVASLELQDRFSGPAAGIGRSLDGLERQATGTFGRIGGEAQRGLGVAAGHIQRLGVIAAGFAVTGLIASIRAASDLNEEIDKSSVVFGQAATRVQDFSTAAASIGLAKAEALGAAGAFGNMFNTIGFAQDESADMSITMVQLAADMASFNNEDPTAMLDRLRSGLAGEAEPLRRFGVLLSEATIKEFAYRTGLVETGEALTEAQKVQARYGLILEQTAIQQGNYALTSESLANQQRTLRANLINTATTIGTALLPKLAEFTGRLSEFVTENQPAIQAFADKLPAAFDKLIAFGGNLPWGAIGDAFRVMGTGSKALLDSFLGLPPWVQTAVLTGWGLNKLTGGALGSIVGTLASGLIRGVLGINAGVVNVNAARVGGVGGAGGGGSVISSFLGLVSAAGLGAVLGTFIGRELIAPTLQPAVDAEERRFAATGTGGSTAEMVHNLEAINAGIDDLNALGLAKFAFLPELELLETQRDQLEALLTAGRTGEAQRQMRDAGISAARSAESARHLQALATANIKLQQIAAKDTSPKVNVNTSQTVYIDGRTVAATVTNTYVDSFVGGGHQADAP